MRVIQTNLPGVLVVEPRVFSDDRGFFLETWNAEAFAAAGLTDEYVQDNVSFSRHGVLRGLHFQQPHAQGKLVTVLSGEVFDVAVDVRVGSPTFGQWCGVTLSEHNHHSLLIPAGFAHGFVVTGPHALFSYKCTAPYRPASERSLRWDDPAFAIAWPLEHPTLSAKDAAAPTLATIATSDLPSFVDDALLAIVSVS